MSLQSCPKIVVQLINFHACLILEAKLVECFLSVRFYVKSFFVKSQSRKLSFLVSEAFELDFEKIWALFQGLNDAKSNFRPSENVKMVLRDLN